MSVEFTDSAVAIRRERPSWVWGVAYLVTGASIIWYAVNAAQPHEAIAKYVGVFFGLVTGGAGLGWLLPISETLVIDAEAQQAREITFGWLGRRVETVSFTQVASIGTDTLKDPRNGAIWEVRGILRLKDGRSLTIYGADVTDRIGQFAGFAVVHRILMCEEPPPQSG